MSTRGLFGFKVGETLYIQFSSSDSYPSGLGEYWHSKVSSYNLEVMKEALLKSKNVIVEEGGNLAEKLAEGLSITKLESKNLIEIYDEISNDAGIFDSVYNGDTDLLLNDIMFMQDSLFCEYVYYYDYNKDEFVMLDRHEDSEVSMPLSDERWQNIFSVV